LQLDKDNLSEQASLNTDDSGVKESIDMNILMIRQTLTEDSATYKYETDKEDNSDLSTKSA
jgi:hypothetical protein